MKLTEERGLTLIELVITLAIIGLIATAATALLSSVIQVQGYGSSRAKVYHEGLITMERITKGLRTSTYLLIPNAHNTTRDILAFSGKYNDDNDFYFNDPLFPRIDEDPAADMDMDNASGIGLIDDDGDGTIDDGGTVDDDEDGLNDEDQLDGIDNDGDGNLDEDITNDINNDLEPGIESIDDDGDGSVDEGNFKDDDEDGSFEEDQLNPIVYLFDSANKTLSEWVPHTGQTLTLSDNVTSFQVIYEEPQRILVSLTLTNDHGDTIELSEYVCPRNVRQKTGRRVR